MTAAPDFSNHPFAIETCRVCAYDLRGSPPGACPECGTPFGREQLQLFGDRLGRSPIHWGWPLGLATIWWVTASSRGLSNPSG